jgi:cytosine/adenosine deaminase-related metal-dependent hydrolase
MKLLIRGARLLSGEHVDIGIANGLIASITPSRGEACDADRPSWTSAPTAGPPTEAEGRTVGAAEATPGRVIEAAGGAVEGTPGRVIEAAGRAAEGTPGRVIEAAGRLVAPGLIDAHRHGWQAPLRGIGPDMTLTDYLEEVLGRALPAVKPDDLHRATLRTASEALDAGITTVFDWSHATIDRERSEAVLDAYEAAGIRAVVDYWGGD